MPPLYARAMPQGYATDLGALVVVLAQDGAYIGALDRSTSTSGSLTANLQKRKY